MGFGEVIKGVILITSWLIILFTFSVFVLFSHLLVLLVGSLIFIYERIKGKKYGR